MSVERSVSVRRTDLADFHEALAWVVQVYDRDFSSMSGVNLTLGQSYAMEGEPAMWCASVIGMVVESP